MQRISPGSPDRNVLTNQRAPWGRFGAASSGAFPPSRNPGSSTARGRWKVEGASGHQSPGDGRHVCHHHYQSPIITASPRPLLLMIGSVHGHDSATAIDMCSVISSDLSRAECSFLSTRETHLPTVMLLRAAQNSRTSGKNMTTSDVDHSAGQTSCLARARFKQLGGVWKWKVQWGLSDPTPISVAAFTSSERLLFNFHPRSAADS